MPTASGWNNQPFLGSTSNILVNKQSIQAAFVSLKTIFNKAFAEAPSSWQKIAMKVPSTTGQNDYAWLSNFPEMRRWIGAKQAKSLVACKYSVVNEDFEARRH
jgi:phage major head subunit gpT-like protein